MKLSTIVSYKVVEGEKYLVMCYSGDRIAMPGAIELVIGDLPTCAEFIARYTEHRAAGHPVEKAKELALRGARIISVPKVN